MTLPPSCAATRAALFMRRCRVKQSSSAPSPIDPRSPSTRTVSSSHLAPSNFSKHAQRRETAEGHQARFPQQSLPSQHMTRSQPPKRPVPQRTNTVSIADRPIPPGFLSFVKHRILNIAPPPPPAHKPPPFNVLNNPYRTKKRWPPDFSAMRSHQQFHFEKTFRRRILLKTNSRRYNWNRYVRLLQQSLIILTVIYFVFIADPYAKDGGGTPMDGFRAWFFGQVSSFEHLPDGLREQADELKEYYQKNWKKAPWERGDDDDDGEDDDEKNKTGISPVTQ